MKKIALIDLDGTLCDYDKSMTFEMSKISHPNEPSYKKYATDDYLKARKKLIQNQPGFWLNLEPLKLGFDIIEDLTNIGFSLNVLTQGPKKSINAWSEKVQWCHKYLPGTNITITQDKALSYGRVLVDDFSPYFLNWLTHRPRGLVVCVAHPWNEMFSKNGDAYQSNVFRYDGSNRNELKKLLQESYSR